MKPFARYDLAAGTLLGILAPAAGASAQQTADDTPRNILLLVVDDLRPELGCYGQRHMLTPNIDSLALDGTVFNRAYVQYAVSAATRASFLTGCYPETTGVGYPYSTYFVEEFLPGHATIQRHMLANGFYTRTLGKVHHGFSEDLTEPHFSPRTAGSNYLDPDNAAVEKTGRPDQRPLTEFLDLPDESYPDGKVADETVATLRRAVASKERFFIAAGFLKPHLPFVAPRKYYDLYDNTQLPDCPYSSPTVDETPYSRSFYNVATFRGGANGPDSPLSDSLRHSLRRAYFACVSFTDAQIGRIVNELKALGVYDNTTVVLIGDHGWHLGDNGMWGKQTNFERATRAPLIVKAPASEGRPSPHSSALVEFVDIYPTLCDLADVETPSFVEGVSFRPLLRDGAPAAWKKAAFSCHPRGGTPLGSVDGRTIRTPHHRYVEWSKQGRILGRELYDHRTDSLETHNIASAHPALCDSLSAELHRGWRQALPDGAKNLSANEPAPKSPAWGAEAAKNRKKKAR